MDVLTLIRNIDTELSDWLLLSRPTTLEEKEEAKRVLFLLNRLGRMRHELILEEFKLGSLDLSSHVERLTKLNERISKTAKDISTAKEAIGIAATVIAVVVEIVGLLAL